MVHEQGSAVTARGAVAVGCNLGSSLASLPNVSWHVGHFVALDMLHDISIMREMGYKYVGHLLAFDVNYGSCVCARACIASWCVKLGGTSFVLLV